MLQLVFENCNREIITVLAAFHVWITWMSALGGSGVYGLPERKCGGQALRPCGHVRVPALHSGNTHSVVENM